MVTNQIKKNTGGGGATIPEGVDQAELGYLDGVLSSIQDQLNARELVANKNQAGGYAGLDGSARLPAAQLPTTVPVRASGGAQYSLPGYNASGDFVDSGLSFASGTLNGALTYIQRSDENRIILNGIGGNLVKGGTNVASWSASGLFVGAGGGLAAAALECRSTSQQARFSYSDLVYWDWITTASNNAQLSRGGVNEWVFTRSGTNPNFQCNHNSGLGMVTSTAILGLGIGSTPYLYIWSDRNEFRKPVQLIYSSNVPSLAGDPGVTGEIAWDGVNLYLHDGTNWRQIASVAM